MKSRKKYLFGKSLDFIKDNNSFCNIMNFSAPGRPVAKERFEKLDSRGYDNWIIPVLTGKLLSLLDKRISIFIIFGFEGIFIEAGMVFE
ncbi:MAG TPA: hypothetical protein DCZ04_00870, partial [Syntrophorhabdus aromaticivorans]|nr:hypothetical protein [Syntrophorhabdus aromaticivorans]